jgi:uncharacterized Fe-S cluster protein YjdI
MERKGKAYRGQGLVVYFDPRLCIHAAECLRGLPPVFDRDVVPWIRPNAAAADAVAAVVARCPSGALHADRLDGGPAEGPSPEPEVLVMPNGPLHIRGRVEVQDGAGALVRADTRMALCRCGASGNKPFCDNSHRAVGFRSA